MLGKQVHVVLDRGLIHAFLLLNLGQQLFNFFLLREVSFALSLLKGNFFVSESVDRLLVLHAVLLDLLGQSLRLTRSVGRMLVRHVDRPQDIGSALRANYSLVHSGDWNPLVLEVVGKLLFLRESGGRLLSVRVDLLGGLAFLQVDVLLNRVGRRQNILNLALIVPLSELKPIALVLDVLGAFPLSH